MRKVIFACIHNAGRSQMAAAFFNQLADRTKAEAVSAGTDPGVRVHPVVLTIMQEVGIDLSSAKPQKLTQELANDTSLLITVGCGDNCPYVPGLRREDWPLKDPKGLPVEEVRVIREAIRRRVQLLLQSEGLLGSSMFKVTRLLKVGTFLLLLAVFLAPICEFFDRWDAPGLENDTEMAVFLLALLLCLVLAVCRILSNVLLRINLFLVGMVRPERGSPLCRDEAFAYKLILPPIAAPLRI